MINYLRKGSRGVYVERWQFFLVGCGLLERADGVFGLTTHNATVEFQKKNKLTADGIVGNSTYATAMKQGFILVEDNAPETEEHGANWPPKPNFKTWSKTETEENLGTIKFKKDRKGILKITNGWDRKNITTINIPQLNKIGQKWGHDNGDILFNKKAAKQMIALWNAWEKAGYLEYVLNWGGSYQPRFIRGSTTRLSNHAYGTAFDINIRTNALGKLPPLKGQHGSVREMVPLANKYGFFWGGHYDKRKDGMHFELAKFVKV